MIKNDNINEESINSIKEFRKKQIQTNIKLHIIFFIMILILNIGLLFFIINYKSKISEIKLKTKKSTLSINTNKDTIIKNNNDIEHKLVNILAKGYEGNFRFSSILELSEEIQTIKNYIVDIFKNKYSSLPNLNASHIDLIFRYQFARDGDSISILKEKIDCSYHTLFLIQTDNEMKFGLFIEETILINDEDNYTYKDNNCFLFSFQKKGIFKCIGEQNKLEIDNNNNILIIGDRDIIIKDNFLEFEKKLGIINYPFKSFDISTINKNVFTEINGEIKIRGIEIFTCDIIYIDQ